ncbi:MAG: elongation factor P [Verrucomicrobiota bacterium]
MQTILPAQFRRGLVLMLDGAPHLIESLETTGTAKTKHRLHAHLRNLKTGRVAERGFQDNEHVPMVELRTRSVQFSYHQGDQFVFLNAETFEELTLTADQIGDRRGLLKENEEYKALFLDDRLLDIVLPDHVVLKVAETAPPQRSAQQSTYKTAKLENGLEIMVPLFIGPGEAIRVDTLDRKYAGKEHGE